MAMNGHIRGPSSQYKKQGLLKDQLRLVKRKDSDRYEIERVPNPLSFDKGIFLFIRACQLLSQNIKGVVLVGLAGPSGAGKTVFSEKVSKFMPGITVISMDNYNDGSRIIDGNFDDPRLTDYDLLLKNISDIKAGIPVEIPIYDFKLSCRTGFSRKVDVSSSRVVIIEGIYALSEKLRPLLDLRVSVMGGVHFDLVKRVLRDIERSCQAPEDIIQQVSETVYPMYKAFIEPDLETAQIRIINKFNPFSGLQSPTYILKSSRIVSEDQIRGVLSSDFLEATEDTYDIYLLPPGEDPETCQSYLRMRNREGKYSLMFEECIIDHPFIISPRITFEVSVRLLGGLMALGYTIATILKRVSHVFTDQDISIKIDKLELLQQKFIQVHGKDRSLVESAARKLGLEGSYIPHPYIEQIQFEKLTAEVGIPDDLKTKLMVDTPLSSPVPSFSWMNEAKLGIDTHSSWTNTAKDASSEFSMAHSQSKASKQRYLWVEPTERRLDGICIESPASVQGEQGYAQFTEQMAGLNEKIDELLSRLGDVETKLSSCFVLTTGKQGIGIGPIKNGNSCALLSSHLNVYKAAECHYPSTTVAPSSSDLPVAAELRSLVQGQRQLTTQLDVMNSILQQDLGSFRQQQVNGKKGWWKTLVGEFASGKDTTLMTAMGITILGLGGLAGFAKLRSSTS
ncbi:hypothetical protein KP509_05G029600 [Ceratopteris richardii]|uniref:CYTH domain-containing protein n=1 Tax=Ceratopteris richardii TaxID=49495 RepID=A0A8T2UPF4_CERRI|nr:hypothetical protein KP509_05G029600 [Ceratopteris richardii]